MAKAAPFSELVCRLTSHREEERQQSYVRKATLPAGARVDRPKKRH